MLLKSIRSNVVLDPAFIFKIQKQYSLFGFLRRRSVIQALPKTNGFGSLRH